MDVTVPTTEASNKSNLHCPFISLNTDGAGNLFLTIVMSIEMIVGLPSNTVALWIFWYRMKLWKAYTLFLFNLVLADFLLIISVPFRIDTHQRGENWVFGSVWCRVNHFMLTVNRSASIAFMTVVALHRYFKVVHPQNCISRMTRTHACLLVCLIWTTVIALSIPLLATDLLHEHGNIVLCRSFSAYKEVPLLLRGQYVAFILEFFLPWLLLLYCSVRITCFLRQRQMSGQKKVRRAIVAVGVISLVFTVCFMPGVITGLGALYVQKVHPTDCASYWFFTQGFKLCIAFTYLNSTLDPVIYCFSSSEFRDVVKSSIDHICLAKTFTPVNSTSSNQ
ncbi:hydroxycarboxylic acid receptor 2 [Betta splendens]|uniref:Hydroxycarboxylic acid receptor 2 n=1 Tax=Betta splendens TaxID=158456 RepID=A0A6P7KKM1_BETSP|nr:hydroxycarboxylic acid receptor 2 [Betta splendens]